MLKKLGIATAEVAIKNSKKRSRKMMIILGSSLARFCAGEKSVKVFFCTQACALFNAPNIILQKYKSMEMSEREKLGGGVDP